MKINIFPIEYQTTQRIGIQPIGFDRSFPALMKKIPGSRWTPKEDCWHIPYVKDAYDQLKLLFGEGQILQVPRLLIVPVLLYRQTLLPIIMVLSSKDKEFTVSNSTCNGHPRAAIKPPH